MIKISKHLVKMAMERKIIENEKDSAKKIKTCQIKTHATNLKRTNIKMIKLVEMNKCVHYSICGHRD